MGSQKATRELQGVEGSALSGGGGGGGGGGGFGDHGLLLVLGSEMLLITYLYLF
jgi:hypothetical protein